MLYSFSARIIALLLRTSLPRLSELEKENLLLRYQLLVLQRQCKKPRFTPADRSFISQITKSMTSWTRACLIVKPDTILRWHKQIAEWTWTTERRGKRPLDPELKALIIRIKRENRLWGPKRIHGELLKLGVQVSETTVRNVLRKAKIEPWDGTSSGTWKEFFKRHENIWAIDFFNVHTAFFQRLFVLVVLDVHSRKLITARVTSRPTTEWVCQVLNWEMTESQAPQAIVHDRDPVFESHRFKALLKQTDTKNLRCPKRTPIANAFVERMNGSLRRECTDHFLFLGERDLQRALNNYQDYYNHARCHQGIDQRTPVHRPLTSVSRDKSRTKVASHKYLAGLHHGYYWAA